MGTKTSETGRFEYLLAIYLHAVEDGNRDAVQILIALWHRWPERFARWVYRHPEDVPDDVRGAIAVAGLDHILDGDPDAAPAPAPSSHRQDRRSQPVTAPPTRRSSDRPALIRPRGWVRR